MCFLTEKEPVWAGMLADVLAQKGIPFVKESSLGAVESSCTCPPCGCAGIMGR